jgi:pimeloyl-ACP methyl ester carboxylesterase
VAHEPPLVNLLPEGDPRRAAVQDLVDTYRNEGVGPAMGKFIAFAGGEGQEQPPSEVTPEMQEVFARMGQNFATLFSRYMLPITSFVPDVAALNAGPTRVVVGVGDASAGQVANDTGLALAQRLGMEAVRFPGGHGGYTEHPQAFVDVLQDVLRGQ